MRQAHAYVPSWVRRPTWVGSTPRSRSCRRTLRRMARPKRRRSRAPRWRWPDCPSCRPRPLRTGAQAVARARRRASARPTLPLSTGAHRLHCDAATEARRPGHARLRRPGACGAGSWRIWCSGTGSRCSSEPGSALSEASLDLTHEVFATPPSSPRHVGPPALFAAGRGAPDVAPAAGAVAAASTADADRADSVPPVARPAQLETAAVAADAAPLTASHGLVAAAAGSLSRGFSRVTGSLLGAQPLSAWLPWRRRDVAVEAPSDSASSDSDSTSSPRSEAEAAHDAAAHAPAEQRPADGTTSATASTAQPAFLLRWWIALPR